MLDNYYKVYIMKIIFISLLALSSMTGNAQEATVTYPPIERFQKALTNKKGKTAIFTIKSFDEKEVVTLKRGKEVIIQMNMLSARDQAYFQRKLKARKPISRKPITPPAPEEKQPAVDTLVAARLFFIGEWEYKVEYKGRRHTYRRIFIPDGTAELWLRGRKRFIRGVNPWAGFTWKLNKDGALTVFDKAGNAHVQYAVPDKNKSVIVDSKSKSVLTKASVPWKKPPEPTTGNLVDEKGKLRRKPAGARYSRVVDLSSLGSDKLPRIVISNFINHPGKAYHAPDGTLIIKGTNSMKLRVVDVLDKNNKERKGLEVTDVNLKKIIDDTGKTILEFSSAVPSWQVKVYDDQGKVSATSMIEVFPQHALFHHPDGRKIKVFGWICHNIASPDGLSVYKGSKYGWLGYDGKLLIPPLYQTPIKYLGNKTYEAEINGETKTITLP